MVSAAHRRVTGARVALVLDKPFFGALALRLHPREDSSCPTMWTDGRDLGYNPDYVLSLSATELRSAIAHEVLHCAMGHIWRCGTRDRGVWQLAIDYAINPVLKDAGFVVPGEWLCRDEWGGQSAEWIYQQLLRDRDHHCDEHGCGSLREGESVEERRQAWERAVEAAARAARAQGSGDAWLDRIVGALPRPTVDWRSVLHRYVQERARDDYSWSAPNRRYIPHGLLLPSLRSETMGALVLAVDISGSISDEMYAAFVAEVQAVIDSCRPESVRILWCDQSVRRDQTILPSEPIDMSPCPGGGGTDFRPVFSAVDAVDAPACLIYLTDLCGMFPATPPDYPVLWATYGAPTEAPWGEQVQVEP